MIIIRFPDAAMEKRAFGFLPGRFSFKSWANGEMLIPEFALPSLAAEGISFFVQGTATYEQLTATIRNPSASAI
jgi:hypothetical protein